MEVRPGCVALEVLYGNCRDICSCNCFWIWVDRVASSLTRALVFLMVSLVAGYEFRV